MAKTETCSTCKFYLPPKDLPPAAARSGVFSDGFCRRRAPHVRMLPGNWCGDFKPANPDTS